METSVAGLITGILFLRTGSLHSPLMKSWRYGIEAMLMVTGNWLIGENLMQTCNGLIANRREFE
jgi:biotin transporter BioY